MSGGVFEKSRGPLVPAALRAVAAATRALGRAASVREVEAHLAEPDALVFGATSRPRARLGGALVYLHARGELSSPGIVEGQRYYSPCGILDLGLPPDRHDSRVLVLATVRRVADALGRAVRLIEVAAAGRTTHPDRCCWSGNNVGVLLRTLVADGSLQTVPDPDPPHGSRRDARLYLPAGYDAERFTPPPTTRWSQVVEAACLAVWADQTAAARRERRRPRPFATTDVRGALERRGDLDTVTRGRLDGTQLATAVHALCKGHRPVFRKVDRVAAVFQLFAPAEVPDTGLDLTAAYLNDSERLAEAVRRAVARIACPAVTHKEVAAEAARDPTLQPSSKERLASVLNAIAIRRDIAIRQAAEGVRGAPPADLVRAGTVGSRPHYCLPEDLETARAYVAALDLARRWAELDAACRTPAARLAGVAAGRRLELAAAATGIVQETQAQLAAAATAAYPLSVTDPLARIDAGSRRVLTRLQSEIEVDRRGATRSDADVGSANTAGAPQRALAEAVRTEVPLMLLSEVRRFAAPLWRIAREAVALYTLSNRLRHAVRLLPNPAFVAYGHGNEAVRTKLLPDRVEVLLYAATEWGGPQARLHGTVARAELGRLRDPRFIRPALASPHPDERALGAACLAFFGHDGDTTATLRRVAENDSMPSVRQVALWAYGFAGGSDALALLRYAATADRSERVRAFAARTAEAVTADAAGWWRL